MATVVSVDKRNLALGILTYCERGFSVFFCFVRSRLIYLSSRIKNNPSPYFIVLIGLLIRFLIMPISIGVDTSEMYSIGAEIVDGQKGIYEITNRIAWPPPYPLIIKACYSLWRHHFSGKPFVPGFEQNSYEFRSLVTIFKIPPLVAELIIGLLIYRIFKDLGETKKADFALAFWLFNPISLFINTMWGKFDVISAAFVVAAIFFMLRGKTVFSALCLGLGIACNMWPIILAPIFFYSALRRSLLRSIFFIFFTALPMYLLSLPYLKDTPVLYLAAISGRRGIGEQGWLFGWSPPQISWFVDKPLTLSAIFSLIILSFFDWSFKNEVARMGSLSVALLALYFALSPYAPQFFIWFYPILIIDSFNETKKRLFLWVVTVAVIGILFFFGGTDGTAATFYGNWSVMSVILGWKGAFSEETYKQLFEVASAFFTGAMTSYVLYTLKAGFLVSGNKKERL